VDPVAGVLVVEVLILRQPLVLDTLVAVAVVLVALEFLVKVVLVLLLSDINFLNIQV
tara:strand:- start:22 stop:192 length:171 start_codon:yes stop_codon:yes gene_type:complete